MDGDSVGLDDSAGKVGVSHSDGTRRCAPHARHPHRIPGDIGSSPAIRWGCRPSRAFANPRSAPPPEHIGRQAEQGGLASGLIGETQAKARSVARLRRSFCGNGGLASADRGEHAARQRPYRSPPAAALVQKAPKTALGRAAAPTQVHEALTRHRRRRRKGGGDVREPQGDDVAQAGRDHEAQEQGAARAADDRAGRDAVRRRHPPEGEMRGGRFRGKLWALFLDEAPCRFGTLRQAGRRCGCRAGMGEEVSAVQTTQLTAN